jgi:hypothetical protein
VSRKKAPRNKNWDKSQKKPHRCLYIISFSPSLPKKVGPRILSTRVPHSHNIATKKMEYYPHSFEGQKEGKEWLP